MRLWCVPLGRPPFLCGLRRQRIRVDFVRPLRWYYEAVRLPTAMNQSPADAKKNARELLDKVLRAQQENKEKNWKP